MNLGTWVLPLSCWSGHQGQFFLGVWCLLISKVAFFEGASPGSISTRMPAEDCGIITCNPFIS